MRGLQDKTVIVTGGALTVRVAVFDINAESAAQTAADITKAGGVAQAFRCDITDYANVQSAVGAAVAALGPIDILVNNAGWDIFRLFKDTTPDQWQKLIAINLVGALNMHHVVLPGMLAQKRGRIVNIASDAARVGSSGEAVYAACKSGLVGFSKTIAREHARHGITVNVVCPGATNTALFADYKQGAGNPEKLEEAFRRATPMGRIGEPDDLPGAILFFASDEAAYITGQVLSVSGGLTMAG
ncbi:MAG: SDR family oxidoreductase [Acetobacteraceae bacterium]|nr:SDR family oxidoreductase [Acetobacteraceae bacterium]